MKLFFALAALAAPISTCATTPAPAPAETWDGITRIYTDPAGAVLTFGDGTVCDSPCGAIIIEPTPMTVAKAGFRPVKTIVPYPAPETLFYPLEAVGRSTGVEEGALPDL